MHYQCYSKINWSGGIYVSPTLGSSRSGLSIALTWTTLLYYGRNGFVEKTHRIIEASHIISKKLEEIEHISVMGSFFPFSLLNNFLVYFYNKSNFRRFTWSSNSFFFKKSTNSNTFIGC